MIDWGVYSHRNEKHRSFSCPENSLGRRARYTTASTLQTKLRTREMNINWNMFNYNIPHHFQVSPSQKKGSSHHHHHQQQQQQLLGHTQETHQVRDTWKLRSQRFLLHFRLPKRRARIWWCWCGARLRYLHFVPALLLDTSDIQASRLRPEPEINGWSKSWDFGSFWGTW